MINTSKVTKEILFDTQHLFVLNIIVYSLDSSNNHYLAITNVFI